MGAFALVCVFHPLRTIDERCTFVAPRKALRPCPTSLTACPRSRRDVFRPLETASLALFRSLTFRVAPRAPHERSLAPVWLRHIRLSAVVRVDSIHQGANQKPRFRRHPVLLRNVFRRVSVPCALGAWCMSRAPPAKELPETTAPSSLTCSVLVRVNEIELVHPS
jgi:hypothetical protein